MDVSDLKRKRLAGTFVSPSDGELQGAFVPANFYATHGLKFKYKLSRELKAENKINYSVWPSIRGRELAAFSANEVGAAAKFFEGMLLRRRHPPRQRRITVFRIFRHFGEAYTRRVVRVDEDLRDGFLNPEGAPRGIGSG